MKTMTTITVLILLSVTAIGQQVTTTMVTLTDLITHAADEYPNEDASQILVLFDAQEGGLTVDQRFYTEQGITLLLKRLNEDDKIAFASYGAVNKVILPYTEVSNETYILDQLQKYLLVTSKTDSGDGIDIAYQYAQEEFSEDYENKVLMIRNGITNNANSSSLAARQESKTEQNAVAAQKLPAAQQKLGGTIAITALSILPEVLKVLKN